MIAEAGLIALWLAAALALLQLMLCAIGLSKGQDKLFAAIRPVAIAQGILVSISFLLLVWLFVRSDMSVKLVVANSASMKPLIYKISGTWGNHEGSMLLWVLILAGFGACAVWFGGNLPDRLRAEADARAAERT